MKTGAWVKGKETGPIPGMISEMEGRILNIK